MSTLTASEPNPNPASPPEASPPEAWAALRGFARRLLRPLVSFLQLEAASGILLLLAAALALGWANSPWRESYARFWHMPIGVRVGALAFERPLEWFVNDGLMAVFFFVVGLEIRREIHCGELSTWRRATLPVVAALGGMLVPAGAYLLLAGGAATRSGWGVPMATDIAFALGVLALLGRRVPPALRVLLLALAVIDDLGAIVVIAAFYSTGLSAAGLAVAALGVCGVLALQRLGVRAKLAYLPPALLAWGGVYAAGIHPTIAGVVLGLLTPVRTWLGPSGFLLSIQPALQSLSRAPSAPLSTHALAASVRHIDGAGREVLSPVDGLIELLHPWVAFGIMPVFALANAGVSLSSGPLEPAAVAVLTGVSVGLWLGKPIGVLAASWAALRSGLATLPAGTSLRHLLVLGAVAGIGFTMALFIAQLAFSDNALLDAAKLGVLGASAGAGLSGLLLGWWLLAPTRATVTATEEPVPPRPVPSRGLPDGQPSHGHERASTQ